MKKVKQIVYKKLPHQVPFHASTKPKVFLSSGYGGGKSHALIMKMIKLSSINLGLPGGFLCPSLKMFKRDILPLFRQIGDENNFVVKWRPQDSELRIPELGTTLYIFHDEDNGDSIKGPNLAFFGINEVTLCSKESFLASIGRVRLKNAVLPQIAMSGTPEGLNSWAYDYFVETPRADTDLIFGRSVDNIHVHESYFDSLKESYDELMQQTYIDGRFVNMNGNAALWAFNRQKHVKKNIEYDPMFPVWVSLDFNLSPMAATLWNRLPDIEGGPKLRAFDEICLNSSNTDEVCAEIYRKLGHKNVTIFPDPAGSAGSTKSRGRSDIDILKMFGFEDIRYKRSILSVRDCLNAANNGLSKGWIEVSDKCKNFIADAERCTMKGTTIDKTESKRTHWLDGFKDMMEYEFPVKAKAGTWRQSKIR